MPRLQLDPKITYGNIIQVLVVVVSISGAVFGIREMVITNAASARELIQTNAASAREMILQNAAASDKARDAIDTRLKLAELRIEQQARETTTQIKWIGDTLDDIRKALHADAMAIRRPGPDCEGKSC